MKRLCVLLLCMFFLCGCASSDSDLDGALHFRQKLISSEKCQFVCKITADYTDKLYTFSMECSYDDTGTMYFTVLSPESISGITGCFDQEGGKLTFDSQALLFPMLAEGQISPVSAPWLFIKTLRGGYIRGCGKEEESIHLIIDDSYQEYALQADIWTDSSFTPYYCEFLWQGRRIVSMEIESFSCL